MSVTGLVVVCHSYSTGLVVVCQLQYRVSRCLSQLQYRVSRCLSQLQYRVSRCLSQLQYRVSRCLSQLQYRVSRCLSQLRPGVSSRRGVGCGARWSVDWRDGLAAEEGQCHFPCDSRHGADVCAAPTVQSLRVPYSCCRNCRLCVVLICQFTGFLFLLFIACCCLALFSTLFRFKLYPTVCFPDSLSFKLHPSVWLSRQF